MLAALASAACPTIAVAGVRDHTQASATDNAKGIDQTVIQDASGKLYDVYVTDTDAGRVRLSSRVKAANTLADARDPNALGFDLDQVIAFTPGGNEEPSVLVTTHREGQARSLSLLTHDDCSAVGTAIGAIHRLRPNFVIDAGYPAFVTGNIRTQLTAWIKRLRSAGHVPSEITDSWARILETEGLWAFSTCTVHGGFHDGDFLFSGSTITAVTNWQDMQVNDPARDLAWLFGKLDDAHRNAVLAAYGRMMGSRLDDLIMLRANLWLQMEQVGDFIQALNRGDNERIIQFKAQVERLAHQLGVSTLRAKPEPTAPASAQAKSEQHPSTITVGTLLREDAKPSAPVATAVAATNDDTNDDTPDPDRTGSADITAVGSAHNMTTEHTTSAATVTVTMRELLERNAEYAKTASSQRQANTAGDNPDDTDKRDATGEANILDHTDSHPIQANASDAPTTVMSLLEREEQALRDARAGLDGYDDDGNPTTPTA